MRAAACPRVQIKLLLYDFVRIGGYITLTTAFVRKSQYYISFEGRKEIIPSLAMVMSPNKRISEWDRITNKKEFFRGHRLPPPPHPASSLQNKWLMWSTKCGTGHLFIHSFMYTFWCEKCPWHVRLIVNLMKLNNNQEINVDLSWGQNEGMNIKWTGYRHEYDNSFIYYSFLSLTSRIDKCFAVEIHLS